MLTEERRNEIVRLINENKACSVTELTRVLNSSEATIRRDLNALHEAGKIKKVHGGATSLLSSYSLEEDENTKKYKLNTESKRVIAEAAAKLIKPNEFIYIDAGTTTEFMADYITEKTAVFVTNGVSIGRKLAKKGFNVYLVAGKLKATTEAIISSEAVNTIERYNFTKGFFGTNGITVDEGYTTPDIDEARIKTAAMGKCKNRYILADSSKFNKITAVTFADIKKAEIITDKAYDKKYFSYTKITEAEKK